VTSSQYDVAKITNICLFQLTNKLITL